MFMLCRNKLKHTQKNFKTHQKLIVIVQKYLEHNLIYISLIFSALILVLFRLPNGDIL
jgi:hypothetical protein